MCQASVAGSLDLTILVVALFREKVGETHLDSPHCQPDVENPGGKHGGFPFTLKSSEELSKLIKCPSHTLNQAH